MVWKNWANYSIPESYSELDCVIMALEEAGQFFVYSCNDEILCTICRFGDKSTTLKLRGHCLKEEIDLKYLITNGISQEGM